jgi:hypothetical protein
MDMTMTANSFTVMRPLLEGCMLGWQVALSHQEHCSWDNTFCFRKYQYMKQTFEGDNLWLVMTPLPPIFKFLYLFMSGEHSLSASFTLSWCSSSYHPLPQRYLETVLPAAFPFSFSTITIRPPVLFLHTGCLRHEKEESLIHTCLHL